LFPQTFPDDAYVDSWGPLLMRHIQLANPAAQLAVIAENGNDTEDALPDPAGEPGFNLTAALAYYSQTPTRIFVQFQVNALTPAQNLANLQTIFDAGEAAGVQMWICTPHPVIAGAPGISVPDLMAQRDGVIAQFPSRYIDAWTFDALPNGIDADPTFMLDDIHWNDAGHQAFYQVVKARIVV
jgi:hypothetical protein